MSYLNGAILVVAILLQRDTNSQYLQCYSNLNSITNTKIKKHNVIPLTIFEEGAIFSNYFVAIWVNRQVQRYNCVWLWILSREIYSISSLPKLHHSWCWIFYTGLLIQLLSLRVISPFSLLLLGFGQRELDGITLNLFHIKST